MSSRQCLANLDCWEYPQGIPCDVITLSAKQDRTWVARQIGKEEKGGKGTYLLNVRAFCVYERGSRIG